MTRRNFFIIKTVVVLAVFLLTQGGASYLKRQVYPLPYYRHITESAARYQVDPFLVAAVIKVESRFNPQAISHRGARGLMQIMPSTGSWAAGQMGLGDFDEDMLFDPGLNIQIGTWYLANLKKEFGGQLPLVIAAYNGGRGTVTSWLGSGIWDGSYENRQNIPYAETRAYVQKVLENYHKYRNVYLPG